MFSALTEDEAADAAQRYYEDAGLEVDWRHAGYTNGNMLKPEFDEVGGMPIWREPDVLDTWFSSALWPFSTLGWPEKTPELGRYYKTDVLITGFDIIFFWVARMMMQGIEFMGEVPFDDVYINSIVVDAKGKKMSKSLGNILDPLELIDAYGADATRFALTSQEVQSRRTLRMSNQAAEGGQRFGTKLWNAARFTQMNGCRSTGAGIPDATQTVNKWIIGETARATARITKALEDYRFNEASTAIYDHVWKVFCDWYVEFSKPLLTGEDEAAKAETQAVTAWALDQCLILLHPIMPFITEELWALTGDRDGTLMLTPWPELDAGALADETADREMGWVIRLIEEIRSVRSEMGVPPSAHIDLVLTGHSQDSMMRLYNNAALVQRLARLSSIAADDTVPEGAVTIALEDSEAHLPLKGVIDVAAEKARLEKALGKAEKEIKQLSGKLSNEGFLAKAPEEVVEEQRDRLSGAEAEAVKLSAALGRLAGLA
jgi:valyl-tRNA synthetase